MRASGIDVRGLASVRRRAVTIVQVLLMLTAVTVVPLVAGSSAPAAATTPTYKTVVSADGPLGFWRLGELSGSSAADASGHGLTGAYSGGVTLGTPGALPADSNTAVSFDGVSGQMSVPDTAALRLNGSFSVEFWARMTSFANTYPGLLVKGSSATADGYLVWYESNGTVHFKRNNVEILTTSGALTSDAFHHFVFTYDGTTGRWYRDGSLNRSTAVTFPASAGTSPLAVGRGDEYGRDAVDEVALYAAALSSTQIANHYKAASTSSAPTVPGAPTGVTAKAANASATVNWTAPTSDGGSAITSYTIASSPGSITATASSTARSVTITGLTNGTAYTFTAKATNSTGTGPASTPSNSVTPAAPTVPGAPTNILANPGDAAATVSWSPPPSDGGSPITSYTVLSSPGVFSTTVSGSARSATVTGLANGTAYTFTVKATNAVGTGPSSQASNPVTPGTVVPDMTQGDWPQYVHDLKGSNYNPFETKISTSNVSTLAPKWHYQSPAAILDQPVIGNGMEYAADNLGNVFALDSAGVRKWSTNLGTTTGTCSQQGVASTPALATLNGTPVLYIGGGDAALYALNAMTGAIVWRTQLGLQSDGAFAWSSPLIYDGAVYMGLASLADCPLNQGKLIKLNPATGSILASVATAPAGCVGGGIWGSPSVDASGDIFFSTGTEETCSSPTPLETSIVRVDHVTLAVKDYWHIPEAQQTPDGDFGSVPTLYDKPVAGTSGHLLAIANKNGNFYGLDRDHLSAGPVWTLNISIWDAAPYDGGGSLAPAAYDGTRLYVAGGNTTIGGVTCKTGMRAVDPATGAVLWAHCFSTTTDGPVLGPSIVANGVVYACEGDHIVGLNASTGAVLFTFTDSSGFYSSPSIAHGVLYAGSLAGTLYALTPGGV